MDPDPLVLCVCNCAKDSLRVGAIFRLLDEIALVEPTLWSRTILVMSKADVAERLGRLVPGRLTPGQGELQDLPDVRRVVPVVNRADDTVTLAEARDLECRFFEEWCARHPGFRRENMGIDGLLTHLDALLCDHMREHWVRAKTTQMRRERTTVHAEIEALGAVPGTLTVADIDAHLRAQLFAALLAMPPADWSWLDAAASARDGSAASAWLARISRPKGANAGPVHSALEHMCTLEHQWQLGAAAREHVQPMMERLLRVAFAPDGLGAVLPVRLCRFSGALLDALVRTVREAGDLLVGGLDEARREAAVRSSHPGAKFKQVLQECIVEHCLLPGLVLTDPVNPASCAPLFGLSVFQELLVEDRATVDARARLSAKDAAITEGIRELDMLVRVVEPGP